MDEPGPVPATRPPRGTSDEAAMNVGVIAIALGGAAAVGLVAWFGAQTIGHEVLAAGWAIPGAILLHLLQLFLSAVAWRCAAGVVRRDGRLGLRGFFVVRWIRESVNSLLPVAQLGGNLVGIRLLMQRGLSGAVAGAATTLDITLEALTQFLFTIMGIVVLAMLDADPAWGGWLQGVVATMAAALLGFIVAQRAGLLRVVEALARRLHRMFPALSVDTVRGLHDELMRLQRDRRRHLGCQTNVGKHRRIEVAPPRTRAVPQSRLTFRLLSAYAYQKTSSLVPAYLGEQLP